MTILDYIIDTKGLLILVLVLVANEMINQVKEYKGNGQNR